MPRVEPGQIWNYRSMGMAPHFVIIMADDHDRFWGACAVRVFLHGEPVYEAGRTYETLERRYELATNEG